MIPLDALAQDGTYPRPQLVRSAWAELCGTWDFTYADAAVQAPGALDFDRTIHVPFPPESEASGVARLGFAPAAMWYRRTITATDAAAAGWCPERPGLLVHFGAVDWAATVWVAGHRVAHHVGGHSPFQVDISEAVGSLEAPVDLIVQAFDDPLDTTQARGKQDWHESQHSIWYERTSGIWQPVWLEAVPDVHITELQWTPRIPDDAVDLDLTLSRRPASPGRIWVRLTYGDRELAAGSWSVEGPDWSGRLHLSSLTNGQAVQELLWSPENPRLVRAEITLSVDGATDAVGSYLGLRTVGTSDESVLLNGRPYFLRAVLDQGYWPQSHLAAPSPEALRDEVRLIKELGFSCVRVHQKAEDPRFLYWADREGLLVWAEMAAAYTFNRRAVAAYLEEWVALVRRNRSHPSIAVWVPLNESWGVQHIADRPDQRAYATALASITRALDPERPVVSNDGWEHTSSDLWTVHDYTDDPDALLERYGTSEAADTVARRGRAEGRVVLLEPVPGSRPVVLSEFGGVSFDASARADSWGYSVATDQEDFADRLGGLLRAAHAARGLAGFCYTQLTDTGLETNGLLRADRTPKLPMATLRALVLGLDRNPELESPQ